MRKALVTYFLLYSIATMTGQQTISFPSKDGLTITADFYESKPTDPYLLLFHQARYSRGEYKETAERFVKLGFNCLAVDLRSGNEVNFVKNETSAAAKEKNLPTEYFDALPDVVAAIEYANKTSNQKVIVLGSSYSASLCMLAAKDSKLIAALILFSPGEYFDKPNLVADAAAQLAIPVFAASTTDEFPYMKQLVSKINPRNLTVFKPSKGKGIHGSSALWQRDPVNNEYWLSLLLFISQIKGN